MGAEAASIPSPAPAFPLIWPLFVPPSPAPAAYLLLHLLFLSLPRPPFPLTSSYLTHSTSHSPLLNLLLPLLSLLLPLAQPPIHLLTTVIWLPMLLLLPLLLPFPSPSTIFSPPRFLSSTTAPKPRDAIWPSSKTRSGQTSSSTPTTTPHGYEPSPTQSSSSSSHPAKGLSRRKPRR